jgi:hypothetical protein
VRGAWRGSAAGPAIQSDAKQSHSVPTQTALSLSLSASLPNGRGTMLVSCSTIKSQVEARPAATVRSSSHPTCGTTKPQSFNAIKPVCRTTTQNTKPANTMHTNNHDNTTASHRTSACNCGRIQRFSPTAILLCVMSFLSPTALCQTISNDSTKFVVPEKTAKYEPKGIVTVLMQDGTTVKGIANSLVFSQSRGDYMKSYVDLNNQDKLPLSYLKTVMLEVEKDEDNKGVKLNIADVEGDTYSVRYSSYQTVSFIPMDGKQDEPNWIYLDKIKSLSFDWQQKPARALDYVLVEKTDDTALLVPREGLLFENGFVANYGGYHNNKHTHLKFDGNFGLPLNKIKGYEFVGSASASYYSTKYEVKILKKNGESETAQATGMITIWVMTSNGIAEIGLGSIKRIIFM